MKQRIYIYGMHCVSCEILLKKAIEKIPWVTLDDVSHKKWYIDVTYKTNAQRRAIEKAIEENNFSLWNPPNLVGKDIIILKNIAFILSVWVILLILFVINYFFDLNGYLPDTSKLTYWGAFLIGLIASVSTCLAITGGIVIGFSKFLDTASSKIQHIQVQLGFQIGRMLGFFLWGGLLWLTGKLINISFSFTGILTFLMGILFIYMGLYIFGMFPSISRFGIHMPKSFVDKIESLWTPRYAPLVGALTFFLPCGFTQTLQLIAIASGSFLVWGLTMLAFSLGTFPVLFSVWLWSSYFNERKTPIFNTIIAGILVIFWVLTLTNSSKLLAYYLPGSGSSTEQETTLDPWDFEEIRVSHNGWSTEPAEINLKKWKNYRVIITPTSNGLGCMGTQVIPKLRSKISYVQKWQDIIYDFTSDMSGTYDIVCASMGMSQGKIVIQ